MALSLLDDERFPAAKRAEVAALAIEQLNEMEQQLRELMVAPREPFADGDSSTA